MLKNFKYMWKNHPSFCLLTWSYLVPAFLVYIATRDVDMSKGAGMVGLITASPFIWKLS